MLVTFVSIHSEQYTKDVISDKFIKLETIAGYRSSTIYIVCEKNIYEAGPCLSREKMLRLSPNTKYKFTYFYYINKRDKTKYLTDIESE